MIQHAARGAAVAHFEAAVMEGRDLRLHRDGCAVRAGMAKGEAAAGAEASDAPVKKARAKKA